LFKIDGTSLMQINDFQDDYNRAVHGCILSSMAEFVADKTDPHPIQVSHIDRE
jgi:hypothetical protein